jgi:hypothetical protein
MNRVTAQEANVIDFAVFDLFRRNDHNVADLFHGNKSDVGISFGDSGDKSALAATDLDAEALFIGEQFRKGNGSNIFFVKRQNQIAACLHARFAVLSFSRSHIFSFL